jgi:carbonyl reductase 1
VRNLALQYAASSKDKTPTVIYLTARSEERGAEAVGTLSNDPQLKQVKALQQDGGSISINFHALDISDSKSIDAVRDYLTKEHPEGLDVVINNAGIALQGFDSQVVQQTLQTNYYGTLEASQKLLPLVKPNGRLVNVSSQLSYLDNYSSELRDAFHAASGTSVDAVSALMSRFQSAVDKGEVKESGFPSSAYGVSKAGVTAVTKVLAKLEAQRDSRVLVNACCPGYVKTDMTRGGGMITPDEGAQTPVMLALGDIDDTSGEFWKSQKVQSW